MDFSFIKNNKVDLSILINKWNDNFFIHEYLSWKESTYTKDPLPQYYLYLFRNKRFYEFDLTEYQANYLIWFLDLISFSESKTFRYCRKFYNKEAHCKVIHGYLTNSEITFDQEYGPKEYKNKLKYKLKTKDQQPKTI